MEIAPINALAKIQCQHSYTHQTFAALSLTREKQLWEHFFLVTAGELLCLWSAIEGKKKKQQKNPTFVLHQMSNLFSTLKRIPKPLRGEM